MNRRLLLAVALLVTGTFSTAPVANAGGGCRAPLDEKAITSTSLKATIAGCAFQPTVTYIDAGETLTWTNKDSLPHTVSGAADAWGSEDPMRQGDTATYTFEDEGVFPYYCAYHPAMVGAVVVGDGKGDTALSAGGSTIRQNDPDATTSAGTRAKVDSPVTEVLMFGAIAIAIAAGALFTRRAVATRRRERAAATTR